MISTGVHLFIRRTIIIVERHARANERVNERVCNRGLVVVHPHDHCQNYMTCQYDNNIITHYLHEVISEKRSCSTGYDGLGRIGRNEGPH
jgi:hypothetical protein